MALDQWSKQWATANLAYREPVRVIGDLVSFTYTRNSGIAFGMFAGKNFPFYIFSIVAALAVFWLWARHPRLPLARQWSLALILGGAVGNLVDRMRTGEVVDFILLAWRGHEFPVFNVADICVTCGVILFALVWSQEEPAPAMAGAPADGPAAPDAAASEGGREDGYGSQAGDPGPGHGSGSTPRPLAGEGADRPLP